MNMKSEPMMNYTDLSTPDSFRFVFRCDRCGAGVPSERYLFSTKEFLESLHEDVRALLWTRQHDEAYERASGEAPTDFNRCPVCGRRVCDECFALSPEVAEVGTDMCVDCKKLWETVVQTAGHRFGGAAGKG